MTDKTHYTFNHILSYIRNIVCVGLICWVAIELKTTWALLAIILTVGSYKHDFIYTKKEEPNG